MRHIDLTKLLPQIFAKADGKKVRQRLRDTHKKLAEMPPENRKAYTERNGSNKWRPIKNRLTHVLGKKCWYTETKLVGAPLAIDHYRPVCNYWWLAFDAENYRVSCPWANSPEHNAGHGCAGGKGTDFPLLPPGISAKGKNQLRIEKPVILDPCNAEDCRLLAFQVDGQPILNPAFAADPIAKQRVERSKLLLNLDHPEFNSLREQLCNKIKNNVKTHEDLPTTSPQRAIIRTELAARLNLKAPFSTAARFYLQFHRHLDWVQDILDAA